MSTGTSYQYLGKAHKLIEGGEKVSGQACYTPDLHLPGMLHARPLLSPYAHAKIVAIDKSLTEQMPGVVAVLTAADLPAWNGLMTSRNSAILATDRVLFRGQPVAVVVATSEAEAQDALDQLIVDYDPLPAVVDVLNAMAEDAPLIWPEGLPRPESDLAAAHAAVEKDTQQKDRAPSNIYAEQRFGRGDVNQGFQAADGVIERTYKTSMVHQSYLEPHAVVAEPDLLRGGLTIYTSTQGQFLVRDEVAQILSLPKSKVRVVPMTIGGGFGAKYGILEPLVSAVALAVRRPVRMVLTRSEDFLTTTPAPATIIELKIGARREGCLTAIQARVIVDNGIFAYPTAGIIAALLGGYYKCPHVQIDCFEVNTHKPQVGAYRAPGAPQATFALESTIDDLAHELGFDSLQFRLQNAAEMGDWVGTGETWPNIGLKLCLERLLEHPAWKNRSKAEHEGIGLAIGGWPCNIAPAGAVCRVDSDGVVRLHVGSVDISGINSSFVLIAAEVLGVSPDQVEIIQGDTRSGPFAGVSGGSQTTYSVSGAIQQAAQEAKQRLLELAVDHFEARLDDLELKEGHVQVKGVPDRKVSIGQLAGIAESKAGGPGPIIGQGRGAPETNAPAFVAHLAKVAVDPDTGQVEVKQYVTIQDVGFALNPTMVEGQIHGGAVQGMGWGLHEAMVYDDEGQLLTGSFMDYDLPRSHTVPSIETILIENPSPHNIFGVRGIGEPPIVPGGAAIANAIKDATGVRVTELPIRPETLWQALQTHELD